MTRVPLTLVKLLSVCKVIKCFRFLRKGEGLGRKRRNGWFFREGTQTPKRREMAAIKSIIRSISVVSVAMMGMERWNSKDCQTRIKWYRQKEEVSLAAGRGVRDTGEG
ncbi:hypothetical protein AVEN_164156-1 [Araneus ventricosus]|uniref:Uncharacterized protein n=1 Tax=Araneus ventricosus TaxID=182803 RepID=A0A4Y2IE77_ARAVE|nr:hypothetical protein AVEN_164156-1 [Araneus ventricosus]